MESMEKAVAKALRARERQSVADADLSSVEADNKPVPTPAPSESKQQDMQDATVKEASDTSSKASTEQAAPTETNTEDPTQVVEPTASTSPIMALGDPTSRRMDARSQLFPAGKKSKKDQSPAAANPPKPPKPATAAPTNNREALKLDDIDNMLDQRLKDKAAAKEPVNGEVTDNLQLMKLLDRAMDKWEAAVEKADVNAAQLEQSIALTLFEKLPAGAAAALQPNVDALNQATQQLTDQ